MTATSTLRPLEAPLTCDTGRRDIESLPAVGAKRRARELGNPAARGIGAHERPLGQRRGLLGTRQRDNEPSGCASNGTASKENQGDSDTSVSLPTESPSRDHYSRPRCGHRACDRAQTPSGQLDSSSVDWVIRSHRFRQNRYTESITSRRGLTTPPLKAGNSGGRVGRRVASPTAHIQY